MPAGQELRHLLGSDTLDFYLGEPFGVVVQHLWQGVSKGLHQALGGLGPDAPEQPAGQVVPQVAVACLQDFETRGLELLAELGVAAPFPL